MTGLLKVGTKTLYVFDDNGETKPVPALCVLDFYVHESRQRAGLGKEMFELMLERENVEPNKLAIDRPSDKLIAFLRKHYGENVLKKSLEIFFRKSFQSFQLMIHEHIIFLIISIRFDYDENYFVK